MQARKRVLFICAVLAALFGRALVPALADTTPTLSISDVTVTEGNSGTVNAVLAVKLSSASANTVTVGFGTANNTAVAPADYVAQNGTLTFAPGEVSKNVTVVVKGDMLDEGDFEQLTVVLSSPVNAQLSGSSGTVTIADDDGGPNISIDDATLTEGDSGTQTATLNVTLSSANSVTTTVRYRTSDGSARVNDDYTLTSGTLTFA